MLHVNAPQHAMWTVKPFSVLNPFTKRSCGQPATQWMGTVPCSKLPLAQFWDLTPQWRKIAEMFKNVVKSPCYMRWTRYHIVNNILWLWIAFFLNYDMRTFVLHSSLFLSVSLRKMKCIWIWCWIMYQRLCTGWRATSTRPRPPYPSSMSKWVWPCTSVTFCITHLDLFIVYLISTNEKCWYNWTW